MATATSTTRTASARRTEPLRLPRTTGALSGILIIALGIWGGLIVFVGPYFHYSFGGDQTWHFTMQRLWLDILPGAVAVLGGLMLLTASTRVGGITAGWIALIAGAWFAIGPAVSLLWDQNIYAIGAPHGGSVRRMLEWVGYFHGLGVVIVGLAAFAMGRYFSRPRLAGEAAAVAADAVEAERAHHARRRGGVAAAPAERAVVADRPVEREAYADEPAARGPASETRAADAPAEREMAAERDMPADRGTIGDAPAANAPAQDAPAQDAPASDSRAADAPVQDGPAGTGPAAGYAPAGTTTTTGTRRSGGLMSRFRRR